MAKEKCDYHDLICKVKKEVESATCVDAFSRMLRRRSVKDGGKTSYNFELSMDSILSETKLKIERTIFVKDIPWTIELEPKKKKNGKETCTYDVHIICSVPRVIFCKEWEISATIRFKGPSPISMVSKTQIFRAKADKFIIPECVCYNKLINAEKKKNKMYQFNVNFDIKKDHRILTIKELNKKDLASQVEYVKNTLPPIDDSSSSPAKKHLSIYYTLFSEDTINHCTADQWYRMFDYITECWNKYRRKTEYGKDKLVAYLSAAGFNSLFVKLLDADFTEGRHSTVIFELIILHIKQIVDQKQHQIDRDSDEKLKKLLTKEILSILRSMCIKMKSPKTSVEMTSSITYKYIPSIINYIFSNPLKGIKSIQTSFSTVYSNYISDLTPFHIHRHASCLCKPFFSSLCWNYNEFAMFYRSATLQIIRDKKLQTLPIATAKLFLRTIAENKINPFFVNIGQDFTFNNLSRLIKVYGAPEHYEFWLQWLKDHGSRNPLLFDLIPPDLDVEVPFTSDCGCYSYDSIKIPECMPVYDNIYRKYLNMVCKPLEDIVNKKIVSHNKYHKYLNQIEEIKMKGNKHHEARQFAKAVECYDEAIDLLMYKRMHVYIWTTPKDGQYSYDQRCAEDLLTVCRNNRVSAYLGLEMYEDAIVDATLVRREIEELIDNYPHDDIDERTLESRSKKAQFKRIKALSNLKLWGHTIMNVRTLADLPDYNNLVLPFYYQSLVMYIKESHNYQFPSYCIMCESEDPLTYKCCECGHPYCSWECSEGDEDVHTKYCNHLRKLRMKIRPKS